jgi:catechol 2,3-dioxygenase-like lactoylglutathione lyase family enzyme
MPKLKSAAFKDATTVAYAEPRRVEPTGILHFTISVTDLEASRDFYVDVVGCTFWRRNDTTMFMKAGEQFFVLSRSGYHQPPNRGTDTLIHNAFIVAPDEFDTAMAYLESKGVEVLLYEDSGHRNFPGRHAYFNDPDGNSVEIIDTYGVGDDAVYPEGYREGGRPKSHLGSD